MPSQVPMLEELFTAGGVTENGVVWDGWAEPAPEGQKALTDDAKKNKSIVPTINPHRKRERISILPPQIPPRNSNSP